MCGIFASAMQSKDHSGAGFYPIHRMRVSGMLQVMKHRGPDSQTVVTSKDFSVGLARLAIIDSDRPEAAQPRTTRKGRVLAFNGELYNYKYLLPSAKSEVELLGTMLDEGIDPRQYLDGDYAILYHDPSEKKVTLYRDRFGICPLYYQLRPWVEVSSERRRLKNPREVPAHGRVIIDIPGRRVLRADRLPHYGITCASSYRDGAKIFESLLFDAVLSRATHSDSGFSAALSGGLDSSAIVLACAALGIEPERAICVAAPGDSDDLRYASLVASRAKVEFEAITPSLESLRHESTAILEHLDHPGLDPTPMKWRASLRNWYVAKHSPTRVILCGEGADEMIEGYPPHTTRHAATPYRIATHQLTSVRSLPHINLDRTNKLGLAHSKEYRAPFLASTLSYWLMSARKDPGKQILRAVLRRLGAPTELLSRPKWGSDEKYFDESFAKVKEK